jgi:hypothetical protein
MAGWLARAIVMENVSVRYEGATIDLPAGPGYRLEKEIKNVITVIAKTCHYWLEHMWSAQQLEISNLFAKTSVTSPLVQPALGNGENQELLRGHMAGALRLATGLPISGLRYPGWLGLECPSARGAIWMMRALVVSNVLARREETVLFVPVNAVSDPHAKQVVSTVARIHGFAAVRGVL